MQVVYDDSTDELPRTCRERRDDTPQPTALVSRPFRGSRIFSVRIFPVPAFQDNTDWSGFRGRLAYCILRAYSSQTGLSSFMNRVNRAEPRMGSKHESRAKAG